MQRAEEVSRGLDETPEQREAITALVEQLEKRNPTKRCVKSTDGDHGGHRAVRLTVDTSPPPNRPTASPLITARWRLIYTTSESILGKTRPSVFRPVGPIYQVTLLKVVD